LDSSDHDNNSTSAAKDAMSFDINPSLYHGFKLHDLTILPEEGVIIKNGHRHHLVTKAMEVLVYLTHHSEQVVKSEQLLEFAWGDIKASRRQLSNAISDIRHAFSDHKECPEFIQTFPKKVIV
jgi:DNA-binding winged helix-turn-helix (wHTH) protein